MSSQTPRGLTKPDSTDHTRLWEHIGKLADDVDPRLARVVAAGQGVGGVPVNPGSSWTSANDMLTPIGPVLVGSRIMCNLSMPVRMGEGGTVQTADLRLSALTGCVEVLSDYWVERYTGVAGDYVEPILRRSVVLGVTGAAGALVTPSAKASVSVGAGAQRLVVWGVTCMSTVGRP